MSTTNEIMDLAGEWAQETKDFGHLSESRPRDALFKAVEALMSDAAQWKAYKARKDAALSAGFGRSPLRGEVAPDTDAAMREYGALCRKAALEEALAWMLQRHQAQKHRDNFMLVEADKFRKEFLK